MLAVRGVDKRLGGREVLTAIGFDCAAGDLCVISGANGSGKSTLLRILVGLVEPDRGTIAIGGLPVNGASGQARRLVGYLPDATDVLPELSVGELVALVQTFKRAGGREGTAAIEAVRERLGLSEVWRQRLATLSFGQRKRALLLAALVGAPPLLVLDEPSNGLDADGVAIVASLIAERRPRGHATVVATNDPAFAAGMSGAIRLGLTAGRLVATAPTGPLTAPP